MRNDQSEPSLDDLRAMAERTEKSDPHRGGAAASGFGFVEGGSRHDSRRQGAQPARGPSGRRRLAPPVLEWGIIGALGAVTSILVIAGSWLRIARRPSRPPEPAGRSRRYHVGSALQPSPSERVRELIQRNPEAAASVLQRWVGQGGRSA